MKAQHLEMVFALRNGQFEEICFLGVSPDAGYWSGIEVGDSVLSTSRLRHVELGHAGGGSMGGCLRLRRTFDVQDSSIHHCTGFGILRRTDDSTDYASANVISDTSGAAVGSD